MPLTPSQRQQIQAAIKEVLGIASTDTSIASGQITDVLDTTSPKTTIASHKEPAAAPVAKRKSMLEHFFDPQTYSPAVVSSAFSSAVSFVSNGLAPEGFSSQPSNSPRSSISSAGSHNALNSQEPPLDLEKFKTVIRSLKDEGLGYSTEEILAIADYSDESLSLFPGIGAADEESDTLMLASLNQKRIILGMIKEQPETVESILKSEQQQGEEISADQLARQQQAKHRLEQQEQQQAQQRREEQVRQESLKQERRQRAQASLPLSLEFDAYHQLRLAAEQQIDRLTKHYDPTSIEKAQGIAQRLVQIEQLWLNNETTYQSPWQTALFETNNLFSFLNTTKRWPDRQDKETNSYKAISDALNESTNLLAKSTILAQETQPENFPEHRLGPHLLRLLTSSDDSNITHGLESLRGLSERHQHALMNAFKNLVFTEESKAEAFLPFTTRTTIPHPEKEPEAFQQLALLFKNPNSHRLEKGLRYALASTEPGRPNAYETPVVDLSDKTPITAHVIAQHKFSDSMTDAVFKSPKSGGANGAGPLGGVYIRYYLDQNHQLQSQLSLIKQATDHGQPNLTDNMRECWGGIYGARLVTDNFAPTTLVIIPGGKAGEPAAIYVESTYIPGFIDVHHAAYTALGYTEKTMPKRAKGRNGGQDILHPKPGSEKLFGDNTQFQEGLIKFVQQCIEDRVAKEGITSAQAEKDIMASFARAIIPRLLLGDKQIHTENVGFGLVNGHLEFVSLDFGGAGRRPFNTSGLHKNTELCGEFCDEIEPFNGKGNKHGACYALAFPLDFYLHEGFIEETRNIIANARNHQEKYFDETIEEMTEKLGKPAVLKHFANEYKKFANGQPAFQSPAEFKTFYLDKQEKRLQSLEKFALELELANIIKNTNAVGRAAAFEDFFKKHPDYQLNWVSLSGEVLLSSKVLRTALEKFSSEALRPEQISQALVNAFAKASSPRNAKPNAVKKEAIQACLNQYEAEKDLYGDDPQSTKASWVMQGIQQRLTTKADELSNDDKQQLLLYIHSYGHKWHRISEHKATYRALTQIICAIYGIESDETHGKKMYKNLMSLSKKELQTQLNKEFPKPAQNALQPPTDQSPVGSCDNFSTSFSQLNGHAAENPLLEAVKNPLQEDDSSSDGDRNSFSSSLG